MQLLKPSERIKYLESVQKAVGRDHLALTEELMDIPPYSLDQLHTMLKFEMLETYIELSAKCI